MPKCSKDNNPNCDYCGLTEDKLDLVIKCIRIQKIWTHHQTILTKLIGKIDTPQQHLLSLNVLNTYKYTRKLTLTIIQIILFEIWRSRNNKNDKKLLPQHTLISKIRKELQTIAQAHYKNTN